MNRNNSGSSNKSFLKYIYIILSLIAVIFIISHNASSSDEIPSYSENRNQMSHKLEYEVLGESGHDGDLIKENVKSDDDSYWCSEKTGLPAWISFDLQSTKNVGSINLRTLDGCNTAPKDIVFYSSEDGSSWNQFKTLERPSKPGSAWWEAPLDVNTRYLKLEFKNNQNQTGNKGWSLYTYLYEVTIVEK
eukprot:TRINITY_DN640_c0_g1_i1.p1 TRINITY_DN640_c0_g1~~TRINITY_DN640_c0_g1_i1.p1  ORF type:complete len:190 (+),score=44.62 TRINITY_DN640_c0_g1_i1:152-721(+)